VTTADGAVPSLPPRPELLLLDAGNTLLFFDHDGVVALLGSQGVQLDPRRLAAGEGAAKRRYESLVSQAGHDHEAGWSLYVATILSEGGGLDPSRARALVPALRAHHEELNLWRRVPEGLVPALERAKDAGIRMAVVSNAEGTVERQLVEAGLRPFLETVVDSTLVGVSKPDPRIFREALVRLDADPRRTVYAGDIPSVDVDGARGAGLDAVLIDTFDHYPSYRAAPRFRSVADLVDAWLGSEPTR